MICGQEVVVERLDLLVLDNPVFPQPGVILDLTRECLSDEILVAGEGSGMNVLTIIQRREPEVAVDFFETERAPAIQEIDNVKTLLQFRGHGYTWSFQWQRYVAGRTKCVRTIFCIYVVYITPVRSSTKMVINPTPRPAKTPYIMLLFFLSFGSDSSINSPNDTSKS